MKKILSIAIAIILQSFILHHQSSISAQGPADPRDVALRKLIQSTMMINQFYVDTVNLSRQVEDAITGMLSKLDPHSLV